MVMSTEPVAARAVEDEHAPPVASRAERIEFLNNSIVFAESNIRAYDTKSQIALAAFVFSMSPLWSILNATCANVAGQSIVVVLRCAFICTIMLYGFVLWPIRPLQALINNKRAK